MLKGRNQRVQNFMDFPKEGYSMRQLLPLPCSSSLRQELLLCAGCADLVYERRTQITVVYE